MSEIVGRKFRTLTELYFVLPEIACAGRCAGSCTVIPMSRVERQRMAAKGFTVPLIDRSTLSYALDPMNTRLPVQLQNSRCVALTEDKRCAVHDIRPLICRLYGVTEDMVCPFACKVDGDVLSVDEAHWLLSEARRIGGGSTVVGEKSEKSRKTGGS